MPVQKKQKYVTYLEFFEGEIGDSWIWIALDPVNKVIVAYVVGKRRMALAKELLSQVHERAPHEHPYFTSDEFAQYTAAILDVYGV